MHGNRGFLMIVVAVGLLAAGGMAVPGIALQAPPAPEAAGLLPPPTDMQQADTCSADTLQAVDQSLTAAPPGCCTTQCNSDKDCNKICGRGNCVCLQQTPCCRRCVY